MSTSGDTVARLVGRVQDQAISTFASSTDELFTALDEGRPLDPPAMVPQIRQAIAGMRALMDEAEAMVERAGEVTSRRAPAQLWIFPQLGFFCCERYLLPNRRAQPLAAHLRLDACFEKLHFVTFGRASGFVPYETA